MKTLIGAVDKNWLMGDSTKNGLPWHCPEDLKLFSRLTKNNIIVMGRKTFESLPYKPLANRIHFIISSQPEQFSQYRNVRIFKNPRDALNYADIIFPAHDVFVIGGVSVYKDVLSTPQVDRIILSHLHNEYIGDVYFPKEEFDLIPKTERVFYTGNDFITKEYIVKGSK